MSNGLAPRLAAFEILARVGAGELFDVARDRALGKMSAVDRGLAHQLAAGVLRNRTRLDMSISPLVSRKWEKVQPGLKDVLRIGAYQILSLNRIPAYAAVDASVELAKLKTGKKTAGLVNAVLRKLKPRQETPDLNTPSDVASEFSHPEWLVNRWVEHFGFEKTLELVARNNSVPPLTVRPINVGLEELKSSFLEAGIPCRESAMGAGLAVAHQRVTDMPGFKDGAFIIQDPAQSRLVEFAGLPPSGLVWDACAAPGGKSALAAGTGRTLIASDYSPARTGTLRETVQRIHLPGTNLLTADASNPPFGPAIFDAVLIDAPCSATGTLRKHPDARWRLSQKKIEFAVATQRRILDSVAPLVKTGGLLVYMTCSLEPEENEHQIDSFLVDHPDFERTRTDLSIFPSDHGTDGAYGARLTKIK